VEEQTKMASFYRAQRLAFTNLRGILENAQKEKRELSIPLLIITLTEKFDVSEKAILKRIKLLNNMLQDMIVEEEVIRWD